MKLLFYFYSLCLVLASLKDDKVELNSNELIVFTDIKKEDFKISFQLQNKEVRHIIDLRDVTEKIGCSKVPEGVSVFQLSLPDDSDMTIFYTIKSSDRDTSITYKSTLTSSEECDKKIKRSLTHPIKVGTDLHCLEISYTKFHYNSKDSMVCVISDELEKKVSLDKSLEYLQFKIFAEKIYSFKDEVFESLDNIVKLRKDSDFPNRYKMELTDFHMLLFDNILSLKIIFAYGELNYNSLKYESSIIRENIPSIKQFFYEIYNSMLSSDRKELKPKKTFNNIIKNVKDEKFNDIFYQLVTCFEKVEKTLLSIGEFFDKKDQIDKNYVDQRNKEYRELIDTEKFYNVGDRIKSLRENCVKVNQFIFVKFLFEHHKLLDSYFSINNIEDGENLRKMKTMCLDNFNEMKIYFEILVNYECLFSSDPKKYFSKLNANEKFTNFNSNDIVEFLKKTKEFFEAFIKKYRCYNSYTFVLSFIDDVINDWKYIVDNKEEVGLLTKENPKSNIFNTKEN